jgi:hypothetical protein
MYEMRAECVATEGGIGQLWHVLDPDGSALCGRLMGERAKPTPDDLGGSEEYCIPCLRAIEAEAPPSALRRAGVAVADCHPGSAVTDGEAVRPSR